MELEQFCSASRVVIVAGKGGVGKTTVTAALAVAAARTGMSVLIVEVEGKSGLAACFGTPPLEYEEAERAARASAARTLTPDAGAARVPRGPRAAADLASGSSRSGRSTSSPPPSPG